MFSKLLLRSRFALLCVISLLAAGLLAQTTINVGPGQTYTTIQSGIDAANNGDTVLVAPGTYNENIDFKGKAITVTSSGGAAVTIIDGGSRGPAVTFKSGETQAAVISGFTIQHGGEFGWIPTLPGYGIGNIYILNSAPTILNNTITLGNCWGIESMYSEPLIQNNTISATLDPVGNCSFGGGAAILIWGINGQHNQGDPNSEIIIGNTIENNVESGLEDAGGNGGAGIAVWGGNPLIMNNIIRNNASPGGSGGAINFESSSGAVVAQNLIYGNSAGCGGGAIATDGQGEYIVNNTIVDNVGIGNPGFSECTAIAQIYPSPDTYGNDNPRDIFINNIISGSTSYPAVNCSWFSAPSEAHQPTFENNILYNAGGPFFGSYCVDVSGKYNNIPADPQFVSPSAGDYHLKSTSPAIDTGLNSVLQNFLAMTGLNFSNDFDGKARVQDGAGKGCIIDMGAYEYPGSVDTCGLAVSETLTSSLNPAMAGQSVTFTAQLNAASATPTGDIQFFDGAILLSTQTVSGAGTATFATSSLTVGSHTIIANYQPTGTFDSATASLIQVIDGNPTRTALTCLPNPIDISQTAQFTTTVTSANGTPTGSVSFTDNGASLAANGLVGSIAALTYTGSVVGIHNIVATYVPTGPFAASSATCSEIVNTLPTTSTLDVAGTPTNYGTSFTLTATVSPATPPGPSAPTGTVTFYNGASAIGVAMLTGGVATLSNALFPGGNYILTCTYSGSSIYSTSNCNPIHVFVAAVPTSTSLNGSPNPGYLNQTITFTANVSAQFGPVGHGNVTFYDGIASLGSAPLSDPGTASITTTFTTAGTHNITAVFDGYANSSPSTSAVFKETILAGDFSIGVLPGAANVYTGQAAAVKVSITSLQGFSQPLTLTCSGLPANATCNFNSTILPEGQGAANLVIQTAAPQKDAAVSAAAFSALTLLLLPGWKRRRSLVAKLIVLSLVIGAGIGMSGCGSVSQIGGGTPPGTYQIAVTATTSGPGPTFDHSAVVTLTVKSLF